jgi:DNA/RNA endonuclease YhcR with UshA esterase domain
MRIDLAAVTLALLFSPAPAQAHHSFAAFFDPTKTVSITGTVTDFRFTNPHGTITLEVKGEDGQVHVWKAETNAPVVLMRRGWRKSSLKPGDVVTLTGWPSRDGKPYIRLQGATDASGKPIGSSPFGQNDS